MLHGISSAVSVRGTRFARWQINIFRSDRLFFVKIIFEWGAKMAFIPRDDGSIFGRWWWTVDRWSIVALLILIGMGIVMAFAASPAIANRLGAASSIWQIVI